MKRPNVEDTKYNGTISCDGVVMWINDKTKCIMRINGIDYIPRNANGARCWIHQDEESGSIDITVENTK